MSDIQPHGSEVARIMRRIREEYAAAQQGLSGLASGTSQHLFITQKMENMLQLHDELQVIIGETPAIALIAEQLDLTVEGSSLAPIHDLASASEKTSADEPSATPLKKRNE
jgi:hypothetical protein